jgi:hypothetical protein
MKQNLKLKPNPLWYTVKDAQTFNWCFFARKTGESLKTGRLETAIQSAGAPVDDAILWILIDWKTAESHVRRLQLRIAKAVKEKKWGRLQTLQHLLTNSFYAKLLAVKRVTSNKGKNTPGVDGVLWQVSEVRDSEASEPDGGLLAACFTVWV